VIRGVVQTATDAIDKLHSTAESHQRVLALRFGAAAVRCVANGDFGKMVALDPPDVRPVQLAEALKGPKFVPIEGDAVAAARALGISFGDG